MPKNLGRALPPFGQNPKEQQFFFGKPSLTQICPPSTYINWKNVKIPVPPQPVSQRIMVLTVAARFLKPFVMIGRLSCCEQAWVCFQPSPRPCLNQHKNLVKQQRQVVRCLTETSRFVRNAPKFDYVSCHELASRAQRFHHNFLFVKCSSLPSEKKKMLLNQQ